MANILGLQFGHDGSVCLVRDGKLEACVATERITRKKKDQAFNDEVIDYVLQQSNLTLDNVDCIATNDFKQEVFGNKYLVEDISIREKTFKSYIISHHLAHCASVYYTSSFNDAYCFSMDCSMGKPEANSLVAYGKGKRLIAQYCPNKMEGVLYGEVTEKLGLGPALHKAGTTMGLASYGTPFEFDGESYTDEIKHKMDVAATVQRILEQSFLSVIEEMKEITLDGISMGSDNLCLSGGSFLNCNANARIVKESKFKNFHIYPACGDDGTSVGSALYVAHHIFGEPRHDYEQKDLCYTGKDYQGQEPDYKKLAQELANGKIIGWFQGKSEFGPRALGNRSILADPRNPHTRDIINHVVKKREWFRPFAPVVLEEYYQDWFDFPIPSPYMLYTAPVKQADKIPAVTHVDGSARFQTINEKTNPNYYRLVKAFYELTGVPVLLNTSLNGNGEPILETPEQADEFFNNYHLDMMVINGEVKYK